MSVLNVLRLGNPVLRQRSEEVPIEELSQKSFQRFIHDMVDTMREFDGVGLAAPQVGELIRMVVIESEDNPRYPGSPEIPLMVLINPVLRPLTEEKGLGWEGCLSLPGLRGQVPRFREVSVEGIDPEGRPLKFEAKNFFAVVIQHEVDHLDGIVYLDRMEDMGTLSYLEEFQQFYAGKGGVL
ncbi:MAG: peptide deformylase [Nitrospirae bacterium]|nr:peptide deformylase [Nitrospirota bacterium]